VDIYINVFASLLFIKILCDYKPMNARFLNNCELLNEINLLFIYYFMFLFTEFVPDVELRWRLGFYFIYLVGMVFFINVAVVSYSMFNAIYLQVRQKKAKKEWKKYWVVHKKMVNYVRFHSGESKLKLEALKYTDLEAKVDYI
jgi:hypothetical protein